MKQLNKKIISTILLFIILSIWFNVLYIKNESFAATSDIYDVVLFWGQSNMVGQSKANKEDRYDPADDASVSAYSKETGIDKGILANNGSNRNEITISQKDGTVFEYLYSQNTLKEINTKTKELGESLYYQYDNSGNLTKLGTEANTSNLLAMTKSSGMNLIPEFGKIWYEKTGHKMVAVFCAYGGQKIEQFLPKNDSDYPTTGQRYMYEAIKTKWNAAINYLNKNNYKIGNKLYVVCQGEANINDAKDTYKKRFKKVHNNMKKDLGITKGAIVETSSIIGTERLTKVNNKHMADEELIKENADIILGSSYPYDRFVPSESQYSLCETKVCYDSNGNKLSYAKALAKASKSVDYDTNTIHFTSAALSQIGKESAESLSKINKIQVSKLPTKTKYIQNYEKFDVSGGEVTVDFSNIKDDVIPLNSNMVKGFDNTKVGIQKLTVTYKGKSTTFDVEIKEKEPTNIEIIKLPDKTEYIQNYDSLDVTGGKLQITYNDTSKEKIDLTNEMISNFDNSKIGTQTLNVTYKGVTTKYNVVVNPKEIEEIKWKEKPSKIEYVQNYDKLDVKGGKIQVIYNDNSEETIELTEDMISGFDNTVIGTQKLTVNYKGKVIDYEINIVTKKIIDMNIYQNPTKMVYIQNYDVLDMTGGKLYLQYNDNTNTVIDITNEMIKGFDNTKVGKNELNIEYDGLNVKLEIEIVPKEIAMIELNETPAKTKYIQNYEKLDVTGGSLKVMYNDNTTEIVKLTPEMVLGFDNSKLGKQKLTIKYGNMNSEYDIEVVKKSVVEIKVYKQPNKIEYSQGDEIIDVTGGKLSLAYNDETTEIIDMTSDMITGFDSSVIGTIAVTVNYAGKTDSYNVRINPIKSDNEKNDNKTDDKKMEDNKVLEEDKNSKTEDNTIAKDILPKAGTISYILLTLILISIIIVSYIKYNKFKDI